MAASVSTAVTVKAVKMRASETEWRMKSSPGQRNARGRQWCALALLSAASACGVNTSKGLNPTPVVAVGLLPETTVAIVPVRITYVLRSLRPALDSLFPMRDSLDQSQCNVLVCRQYVYRRDSLALSALGDRLTIVTHLAYRAQLGVIGGTRVASCGYAPEPMRRVTLSMHMSLYWRKDWRIGARNSQLNAELLDPCLVSALGVDATKGLRGLIDRQLVDFAAEADTAIPRVANLQPFADSLWRSFLEPTALDSTNTLWLVLDPQDVRVAPFDGNGPSFRTALILYARPRVVAGAKPKTSARRLPPLTLADVPDGFDVPVAVELPFREIERRAGVLLAVETATGRVHVDSVHVRGNADTVHIDLDVHGVLHGRFSLVARLRWNAATRELQLDNLDWSIESRGMMSRMKATLAAPLIARAVHRATLGGRVPLGAQLDSVRVELMRKLNGPVGKGVVMGSSVSGLHIIGVTSTATAFVVQARLVGQAGVWFQ